MNKKERRLKRKIEKQEKNRGKNVRLCLKIKNPEKQVQVVEIPKFSKTPRSQSPDNYKKQRFSWDDKHADVEGGWSWGESRQWTKIEYEKKLTPHMATCESDLWDELEKKTYNGKGGCRKKLNKYQSLNVICPEARKRWRQLDESAQFDEFFRLRLGTNVRIWGIRIEHHFFLVWYEREHKICPF